MEDNTKKILLAALAGAAVGVAIGWFLNSDKKEEIVDDLKSGASKIKDAFAENLEKGKEIINDLKNSVEEHFKNTPA